MESSDRVIRMIVSPEGMSMVYSGKTSMGEGGSIFLTTLWSEIQRVRTCDAVRQREVIDTICRKYWKPVYCFLRRKGYNNETAKDLTQGFFYEIVLGKGLIQQADQTIGRFRTFLLRTLEHYLITVHRTETRKKRRPQGSVSSLEGQDGSILPLIAQEMQPDQAFSYVWASNLLDEVLAEVERACHRDGKQKHWELFRARVLEPITEGGEPPALRELCDRLEVENEALASNMIITVKRRFKVVLSAYIRDEVGTEQEVIEEIHDLMTVFRAACAG